MIGIQAVAHYVPPTGLRTERIAASFGKDRAFLDTRIGTAYLPKCVSPDATVDLATGACEKLFLSGACAPSDIDLLILVTQNPDAGGLPHNSAVVHHALGLSPEVETFDLGLGCSGWVQGVSLGIALMQAKGLDHGLVVTSDPYSKILPDENNSASLLFGDAAAVTLLTRAPRWALVGSRIRTESKGFDKLRKGKDGLIMNGRGIYEFAARVVPNEIRLLLRDQSISEGDVDAYLIHQGSQAVVEAVASSFHLPKHRFPSNLANLGNTVSSSLPILLEDIDSKADAELTRFIAAGFGVGLACATALFEEVS